MIESLDDLTTGRYVVTTASGTRHLIDLDNRTAIRQGAPGHEWGDKILVPDPDAILGGETPKIAAHYEPVTPDGTPFYFSFIQGAMVGKRMYMANSDEWRLTSQVQSIEEVAEGA